MTEWTNRGAATRVYSSVFDSDCAALPADVRETVENKLFDMGLRLAEFPHYRLTNSADYRLRVGDYRVIYNFDVQKNVIHLLAVGNRREIYR